MQWVKLQLKTQHAVQLVLRKLWVGQAKHQEVTQKGNRAAAKSFIGLTT